MFPRRGCWRVVTFSRLAPSRHLTRLQRIYSNTKWGRILTYQNVYEVIRSNGKVSVLGPSEAIGNARMEWKLDFGQHVVVCTNVWLSVVSVHGVVGNMYGH